MRPGSRGTKTLLGRAAPSDIITVAQQSSAVFPLDLLDMLNHVWREIVAVYDMGVELPDLPALLDGADLAMPQQAAQTVIANMLSEVIESVGRFSPWYKQPASAFGLILKRDEKTQRFCWALSPDAIRRWGFLIKPLSVAIEKNIGLILASSLLDSMDRGSPDRPRVLACCLCRPPRIIIVERSVLAGTQILCDTCQQPFHPVDESPAVDR